MLIIIAILLGLVEGATEFLPVSSTGHLIIVGNLIGFTGPRADTFEVVIQLGAILAVVWVYFRKFAGLLRVHKTTGFEGQNGLKLLALTVLPALVAGALFHDYIKSYLFNPVTVAISLVVGGIVIILFERQPRTATVTSLDSIEPKQALQIGAIQVLSLVPGESRAASTILGGILVGRDRNTAVEYSFLVAVPIMVAATGYDLLKSLDQLHASDFALFATGFASAFVFARIAIRFLLKYVKTNDFQPFGWYRIVLGIIVLAIYLR